MNTKELEICLKKFDFLSSISLGVFSSDYLPSIKTVPICFIFNTDPSSKSGEHWLAIYVDKNFKPMFFDSYGQKPKGKFLNYIKKINKNFDYNEKRYQGAYSSTCGQFCLLFLFFKSLEKSKMFEKLFSDNLHENDHKVMQIIDFYFNIEKPIFSEFPELNQVCVALGH